MQHHNIRILSNLDVVEQHPRLLMQTLLCRESTTYRSETAVALPNIVLAARLMINRLRKSYCSANKQMRMQLVAFSM